MPIDAIYGMPYTYRADPEMIFWDLLWICLNYRGNGKPVKSFYRQWIYDSRMDLHDKKVACVFTEKIFLARARTFFTRFYKPMALLMNELRKVVFPNGVVRKCEYELLYDNMCKVLDDAPYWIEEEKKVMAETPKEEVRN